MRRSGVIGIGFVACLAIGGCVAPTPPRSTYAPPIAGPAAELTLETTVTVPTRHAYVSSTSRCDGRATVQSPGRVKIPAGRRVLVQQGFYSIWLGHTKHCNIAATFEPVDGQRYVASYQMDGKTLVCRMDLWKVDASGARSPEPSVVRTATCEEP